MATSNVSRGTDWLYAAAVAGVIAGALPLIAGRPAALEDWPGHIARIEILAELRNGNDYWAQFYQINTFMLPNIGVDICTMALHAAGLPVAIAAQVVLVLTYALFVGAASALAWAFRAADPSKPLLAAMLFYNGALMDGFVNYLLGVGIAFALLAAWVAVSRPLWRVLIAVPGAIVIFFCHVISAGLFIVVLGLLELASLPPPRRWTVSSPLSHASPLAAAIPVLILFALSPTSGVSRIYFADNLSVFGFAKIKLSRFVHPLLDGSGPLGVAVLIAGTVVFVGAMVVTWRRGRLIPRLVPGWFVLISGLFVLFLIAPNGVGEGLGLDYRLPPLIVLLALLLVRLDWSDRRSRIICFTILLLVALVRSASFESVGMANAKVFREFVADAHRIPTDSMLLSGVGTPRPTIPWAEFWRPPAEYMGTQAIANRVFVPSVFALRSQHLLVLRDAFHGLGRQFDVSDPIGVDDVRDVARTTCSSWHRSGHVGSVFMVVVYRSAFSDDAFPRSARLTEGTGFQVVDLCVG